MKKSLSFNCVPLLLPKLLAEKLEETRKHHPPVLIGLKQFINFIPAISLQGVKISCQKQANIIYFKFWKWHQNLEKAKGEICIWLPAAVLSTFTGSWLCCTKQFINFRQATYVLQGVKISKKFQKQTQKNVFQILELTTKTGKDKRILRFVYHCLWQFWARLQTVNLHVPSSLWISDQQFMYMGLKYKVAESKLIKKNVFQIQDRHQKLERTNW